jgi:hypothetical protein
VLPGVVPPAGACPVTPEREAAEERRRQLLDPAMELAGLTSLAARIEESPMSFRCFISLYRVRIRSRGEMRPERPP